MDIERSLQVYFQKAKIPFDNNLFLTAIPMERQRELEV
jgi:hypothetical protein